MDPQTTAADRPSAGQPSRDSPDWATALVRYWLVWVAIYAAASVAQQVIREPNVNTFAVALIGAIVRVLLVSLVPVALGLSHLVAGRLAARIGLIAVQRLVADLALGFVLGCAAGVAFSFLLHEPVTVSALAIYALPGVAAAPLISRGAENAIVTGGRVSPTASALIGAALGGLGVFWGLLAIAWMLHRLGNLSGLLEMFLAFPAAAVGGITGSGLARATDRGARCSLFGGAAAALLVLVIIYVWMITN